MPGNRDAQPDSARTAADAARAWVHGEQLASLVELNEQCLELLAQHAAGPRAGEVPLLFELAHLWARLDGPARQRAAACPCLLVDAGFGNPANWAWIGRHSIHETVPGLHAPFFTGSQATQVMRLALTYGWHLARSRPAVARLLLGMPTACAEKIAGCTLRQIVSVADHHPEWLQPRWPNRLSAWRELLSAAIAGEGPALERARMRGVQLLAAEARAAQVG